MAPEIIYTSYFNNYTAFDPERFTLISIAGKSPDWWVNVKNGFGYKRLAPSWSIWEQWHIGRERALTDDHREQAEELVDDIYTNRFRKERLDTLDPTAVLEKIHQLAAGKIPVLMCYEKPGHFCHRHLIADWLQSNIEGLIVEEYEVITEIKDEIIMKGKVYAEATEFSPVKDSSYVAKEYREYADTIAEKLSQLTDVGEKIEWLHKLTDDNGDPFFEIQEAIKALGIALATCLTYAKEYEEEAKTETK